MKLASRRSMIPPLLAFCFACLFGCLMGSVLSWEAPALAQPDESDEDDGTIDPLSVNANCYVCHIPFVHEEISRTHFAEDVTCVDCHGLSAGHVNDENIGATKPDVTYERSEIDAKCSSCHKEHAAGPQQVVRRYIERSPLPDPVVCTDCHGRHRIERPEPETENAIQ